jgi:hypothetical protein
VQGGRERQRLLSFLDTARRQSRTIRFWWRDDDAEDVTPALERLLSARRRYGVPLALAVVPKGATAALARRLGSEPDVAVLQHGWQHRNYAASGEKKIELGGRATEEVLEELRQGFERLAHLFPSSFLPVLVPPWNRIEPPVREARESVGLAGLSTFANAPVPERHLVNTHLDIIDWATRKPLSARAAFSLLSEEVGRRLEGDDEPVGIITHHLVHTEAAWTLLDELLSVTTGHAAAAWPQPGELFDLSPAGIFT